MYVRPQHRRSGFGHTLLNRLLEEASQIGYKTVRLDSARFMSEAHRLYRTVGFREIEGYEDREIPKDKPYNRLRVGPSTSSGQAWGVAGFKYFSGLEFSLLPNIVHTRSSAGNANRQAFENIQLHSILTH